MKLCIIVAGMHRSGTSAITRLINLLGADIARDLLPGQQENNPRGFWEATAVIEIHDRLLAALGSSYNDADSLPQNWIQSGAAHAAKLELTKEIEKEFSASLLFVVKDPRIGRLLPLWLSLLDEL